MKCFEKILIFAMLACCVLFAQTSAKACPPQFQQTQFFTAAPSYTPVANFAVQYPQPVFQPIQAASYTAFTQPVFEVREVKQPKFRAFKAPQQEFTETVKTKRRLRSR